jgi:hypothetical protein
MVSRSFLFSFIIALLYVLYFYLISSFVGGGLGDRDAYLSGDLKSGKLSTIAIILIAKYVGALVEPLFIFLSAFITYRFLFVLLELSRISASTFALCAFIYSMPVHFVLRSIVGKELVSQFALLCFFAIVFNFPVFSCKSVRHDSFGCNPKGLSYAGKFSLIAILLLVCVLRPHFVVLGLPLIYSLFYACSALPPFYSLRLPRRLFSIFFFAIFTFAFFVGLAVFGDQLIENALTHFGGAGDSLYVVPFLRDSPTPSIYELLANPRHVFFPPELSGRAHSFSFFVVWVEALCLFAVFGYSLLLFLASLFRHCILIPGYDAFIFVSGSFFYFLASYFGSVNYLGGWRQLSGGWPLLMVLLFLMAERDRFVPGR